MKSLNLLCFFYINLITWKVVYCEKYRSNDASTDLGFIKNAEDTETDTDFVDPHSFHYDRGNKKMLDINQPVKYHRRSDGVCISDHECRRELKQCKHAIEGILSDEIYTKRLINLLLSNAKLKADGELLTGSITLTGTKAQIQDLRQFGDGKITMRQVDAILSDIIHPTMNIFGETLTYIDRLHITFYEYKGTFIAISATILVLLLIKYVNWSTGKIVIVLLSIVLILGYFVIWTQLIKEAELKNFVKAMRFKKQPIECEPEKMGIWDTIKTWFHATDRCEEYYRAMKFNAFHEVTAIDALTEFVDRLVLSFLPRMGSAMGGFIDNATQPLPSAMKWIIRPILYILILLLFFCSFVKIRLWGPFCGLTIGGGHEQNYIQSHSAMIEQRQPIVDLPPRILARTSDAELRDRAPSEVPPSVEENILAAGDSTNKRKKAKQKNSSTTSHSCCCKNSSNNPHVKEDEKVIDKNMLNEATGSEVRSKEKEKEKEKGDGDC